MTILIAVLGAQAVAAAICRALCAVDPERVTRNQRLAKGNEVKRKGGRRTCRLSFRVP